MAVNRLRPTMLLSHGTCKNVSTIVTHPPSEAHLRAILVSDISPEPGLQEAILTFE